MDFKISKILSGGEHQNLCRFIKRRKNPERVNKNLIQFLEEETFLTT